jgi:hypothetical protein
MSAGYPAALVALLLLVPGTVAGAAPAAVATSPQPAMDGGAVAQVPTPNTTMTVSLGGDGDARWTVTARFDLDTENESSSFAELAREFESGDTSTLGLPAFRAASEAARDSTNRSMTIRDVERSFSEPATPANGTGRLTLSFTWTDFARVENETLEIGDAFSTADGSWLPGLEPSQRLVIEPPPHYGVVDSTVAPTNHTLQWTGPETFEDRELYATFTGGAGPTTPNPDAGGLPMLWMGLGLLVLGGGVIAVYAVTRRRTTTEADADDRDPGVAAASDTGAGGDGGAQATAGATALDDGEGADGEEDDLDAELLSDEERIERLLERNGGRMKQANIVSETGWSNAKVSQLLSAMDAEGRIDKLRIGRENLISFPDEDVTDLEE